MFLLGDRLEFVYTRRTTCSAKEAKDARPVGLGLYCVKCQPVSSGTSGFTV